MTDQNNLPELRSHSGRSVAYPAGVHRPEVDPAAEAEGSEIREYFDAIRRRVWLVVVAVVVSLGVAGYLASLEEDTYRASAVVLLREDGGNMNAKLGALGGISSVLGMGGGNSLGTELELLRSRKLGGEVVDMTGLRLQRHKDEREFPLGLLENVSVAPSTPAHGPEEFLELTFSGREVRARGFDKEVTGTYGVPMEIAGVQFTVSGPPPEKVTSGRLVVLTRNGAIDLFQRDFFAQQRERTNIVDMGFTSDDPLVSQRVTNAAMQVFKASNAERSSQESRRRLAIMQEQITNVDAQLQRAQNELTAFRERQTAYSTTARLQQRQGEMDQVQVQYEAMVAERAVYQRYLDRLRSPDATRVGDLETVLAVPEIASNPLVSRLSTEMMDYQVSRDTMTAGAWGKAASNPDVQKMDQLVRDTRTRLVAALAGHIAALDGKLAAVQQRQRMGAQAIGELPRQDAEELRLTQQVEGYGKMAIFLREQYSTLQLGSAADGGRVELVDAALPGWKVGSGRIQMLVFGLLFGLALGGGGAVLLEKTNTRIRRRDEMERILQIPGLAVIPQIASAGARRTALRLPARRANGNGKSPTGDGELIATQVFSSGAEAYRTLRTNLIFSQAVQSLRTVVVTSPAVGEGRTTVAANLAVTFAQQGMRVLLVDCDLRSPRIHALFGVGREPGLTQLVRGEAAAAEVIRETRVDGLSVIPAGRALRTNPSDLLGGAAMRATLDTLEQSFDLVVLDTPPLMATTAGTAVLATVADGVLLVVRAGHTDRDAAQRALQQLAAVGARVVGAVLNDTDSHDEPGAFLAYEEPAGQGA